jgi:hypothetical protein
MVICVVISLVIWGTDFKDKKVELRQLESYKVAIYNTEQGIVLKGNPKEEGFSSAWFYIPENIKILPDDTLFIRIKVLKNTVRLRYFLLSEDKRVYLLGMKYIPESANWQEIEIPLINAKPFYSSNFPWSLLPDKKPSMYVFVENQNPGEFHVKISSVKVKGKTEDKK